MSGASDVYLSYLKAYGPSLTKEIAIHFGKDISTVRKVLNKMVDTSQIGCLKASTADGFRRINYTPSHKDKAFLLKKWLESGNSTLAMLDYLEENGPALLSELAAHVCKDELTVHALLRHPIKRGTVGLMKAHGTPTGHINIYYLPKHKEKAEARKREIESKTTAGQILTYLTLHGPSLLLKITDTVTATRSPVARSLRQLRRTGTVELSVVASSSGGRQYLYYLPKHERQAKILKRELESDIVTLQLLKYLEANGPAPTTLLINNTKGTRFSVPNILRVLVEKSKVLVTKVKLFRTQNLYYLPKHEREAGAYKKSIEAISKPDVNRKINFFCQHNMELILRLIQGSGYLKTAERLQQMLRQMARETNINIFYLVDEVIVRVIVSYFLTAPERLLTFLESLMLPDEVLSAILYDFEIARKHADK